MNGEISEHGSDHLDDTGCKGEQEGLFRRDPRRQHRPDDDHALGDVLQGDSTCDEKRRRRILAAKSNSCSNSLRKIVDSDRQNEKHHTLKARIAMRLAILTLQLM